MNKAFDNEKYIIEQSAEIIRRVERFNNKLYLEFGGKLMHDYHAARVLPGYDPNVKIRLLQELKDSVEIILCIYAGDIERRKMRADFGISYDNDALKIIDELRDAGLSVCAVVITRFEEQPAAILFKNKLERRGINVYTHREIKGYPSDIELILSPNGYGKNQFIVTEKPLVVVTGPGPGSGKLATCLSQLYHESLAGNKAGFAKFETFPIWNLPLKSPINMAYEAATADIHDMNMIDPFHLESYSQTAVNYNRDIESFPLLKRILAKISGASVYQSPTDMGVNRVGFAISDLDAANEAAKREIIRRYFRYRCEYALGIADLTSVNRVQMIMKELNLKEDDIPIVVHARRAAEECSLRKKASNGIFCGAAIELKDGRIVEGKSSERFHAASSLVINAIKELAGIPDRIHLLSPEIINSLYDFKRCILKSKNPNLNLEETLTALCISANHNPTAKEALEKLEELRGCHMHMTHLPGRGDEAGLRKLGITLTTDPNFAGKDLFLK